jgi:hypothetical protein
MWETWEFVPDDLDLEACRARGIVVLGTHEHRPPCDLRPYERALAVRLLFELGLEGAKATVTVLGGQVLAQEIARSLRGLDCDVRRFAAPYDGVLVAGDALLVAEAADRRLLIGPGGLLEVEEVPAETRVAVVMGDVDADALRAAGRMVFPQRVRGGGRASFAISELGPRPVLELFAAGLRVGAVTTRARLAGSSPEEATAIALRDGVAMDF